MQPKILEVLQNVFLMGGAGSNTLIVIHFTALKTDIGFLLGVSQWFLLQFNQVELFWVLLFYTVENHSWLSPKISNVVATVSKYGSMLGIHGGSGLISLNHLPVALISAIATILEL